MDATRARLTAEPLPSPVSWGYRIEAWGAALLFALLGCLPLDAASGIGGMLARWIGPRLGVSRHRRIVGGRRGHGHALYDAADLECGAPSLARRRGHRQPAWLRASSSPLCHGPSLARRADSTGGDFQ